MIPEETELIIDLHAYTDRQGPGSEGSTLRALDMVDLPKCKRLKVADIGCGTGGQTLILARNLDAEITAVDLFPRFLKQLKDRARKSGLEDRIKALEASMDQLPFEQEKLDLIWSEGAIYNIGFEKGLKKWKHFLKSGGFLAVSEITWTSNSRPSQLEEFWNGEYPEIDTAAGKIRILEDQGFSLTGYFTLPQSDWLESYYRPLEEVFGSFLEKHGHVETAQEIVSAYRSEIDLYVRYKDYYSYGFYIARKD